MKFHKKCGLSNKKFNPSISRGGSDMKDIFAKNILTKYRFFSNKSVLGIVRGCCAIRQKLSKTKFVVDGLKKSCYNNFGSKTQVGASSRQSVWDK